MPTHEQTRKKALAALKDNAVAVLATSSKKGVPHATPMLFVTDDDMNFYVVSREDTHKVRNVRENPNAALSVSFNPPLNIQVTGRADILPEGDLRAEILDLLAQKGAALKNLWPPILRIGHGKYAVIRIIPDSVRALDIEGQSLVAGEPMFIELLRKE